MADNPWANLSPDIPQLGSYLPAPTGAGQVDPATQPNWLVAGLGSGAYGALSQVGSAGQAVAKLVGADGVAQSAKDFADRQKATADTYRRQDLEAHPWSPAGIGYQVAQGLPSLAAFMGAGALAGAMVPEVAAGATAARVITPGIARMLGAGAVALPTSIGSNVQTAEAANDGADLSTSQAAAGVALGLPEAALQSIVPGKLEEILQKGMEGGFFSAAAHTAGYQAAVGGAVQGLTGLMGDPNRGFADRAQEIVQASLSGGLNGALLGGALSGIHSLAKMNPSKVKTEDLKNATTQALDPNAPTPPPPNSLPEPNVGQDDVDQMNATRAARTADSGSLDVDQAQTAPVPDRPLAPLPMDALVSMYERMKGSVTKQAQLVQHEMDARLADIRAKQAPVQGDLPFDATQGVQQPLPLGDVPFGRVAPSLPGEMNAPATDLFGHPVDATEPQAPVPPTPTPPVMGTTPPEPGAQGELRLPPSQVEQSLRNMPTPELQKLAETNPWAVVEIQQRAEQAGLTIDVAQRALPLEPPTPDQHALSLVPPTPPEPGLRQPDLFQPDVVPNPDTSKPFPQAALPPVPIERTGPFADKHQYPNSYLLGRQRELIAKGGLTPDEAFENHQVGQEISARLQESEPTTPQLTYRGQDRNPPTGDQTVGSVPLPDTPDVVLTPGPARPFEHLSDADLIHAQGNLRDTGQLREVQKEMSQRVSPETRMATNAKEITDVVAAGHLPEALRKNDAYKKFADREDAQRAIAAETERQLAANKFKPGSRMDKLATKFGVFDGESNVRPDLLAEKISEVKERAAARDAQFPKTAMPIDNVAEAHQGKYKTLEALRNSILKQNIPDKPSSDLLARVEQAKNDLMSLKPRQKGAMVEKEITNIARDVASEADKAERAARPVEVDPKTVVGDKGVPSPKTVKEGEKIAAREAAKAGMTIKYKGKEYTGKDPLEAVKAAQRGTGDDQTRIWDATMPEPKPGSSSRAVPKTAAEIAADTKAYLDARKTPTLAGQKETRPELVPVRNALKAAEATLSDVMDKLPQGKRFADRANKIDANLGKVKAALKAEDPRAALSALGDSIYRGPEWAQSEQQTTPGGQRALQTHALAELDLRSRIRDFLNPGVALEGKDPVRTQADVNLGELVDHGANGRDLLDKIKREGTSPQIREIASKLLDRPINATAKWRAEDPVRDGFNPGTRAAYSDKDRHIDLYSDGGLEHSILHEMSHAATLRRMRGDNQTSREMNALFDRIKARSGDLKIYGLKNAEEMVAENFVNPVFQDFMKTQRFSSGGIVKDAWQAFKNIVFKGLGMDDRVKTAFDQVMDLTNRLMDENPSEPRINASAPLGGSKVFTERVNEKLPALKADGISRLMDYISGKALNMTALARKYVYGWLTTDHIAAIHPELPGAQSMVDQYNRNSGLSESLVKQAKMASNEAHHLTPEKKKLLNAAEAHTVYGIDIFKPWEENAASKVTPLDAQRVADLRATGVDADAKRATKLERNFAKSQENASRLKEVWTKGQEIVRQMKSDAHTDTLSAYQNHDAANQANAYAKQVYHAYDFVKGGYEKFGIPGFDMAVNPADTYNETPTLHDDPKLARDFWKAHADTMVSSLKKFSKELLSDIDVAKGKLGDKQAPLSVKDRAAVLKEYKEKRALQSPVADIVKSLGQARDAMQRSPYFHLGRAGDYFVSGKIKVDPDTGLPDRDAVAAVHNHLDKRHFDDVAVMHNLDNNSIYFKVRDPAEMAMARKAMQELHDAGHLDQSEPVSAGQADATNIYRSLAPSFMQRAINNILDTKPNFSTEADADDRKSMAAAWDAQHRSMTQALMKMLPENSLTRIYQPREGVQGFSTNMLRSFDESALSNARGIAGMMVARDMGKAIKQLQSDVENVNENAKNTPNKIIAANQAAAELITREGNKNWIVPNSILDALRGMAHAFQIGMSPPYFALQMSQIPSLSLPRLGSTHGYVPAAKALAASAKEAFQAVSAIWHSQDRMQFGMREKWLTSSGLSKRTVDMLMAVSAKGGFNQSGYTHSMLGHGGEGTNVVNKVTRPMSALALYSEMFPRVITALAADKLYRPGTDGERISFIHNKVETSQMNWNAMFNPRATGQHGALGPASPLINQFMGFQVRMTQMLCKEVVEAVSNDPDKSVEENAETKRAARSFLAGHLAAVTLLAGTMGLPMASVAASVFDKLAHWATGRDDWDVEAAYRNFLNDTFGKDAGEIIARGVPRAAGVDFERAGEGNIVPGSSMVNILTEKRKLEDREKDLFKSMGGSAVGLGLNVFSAFRDLGNGDLLNAAIKLSPEGAKDPMEALALAQRGFINKKGEEFPITAGAKDILLKAFGFESGKEEDYKDEKDTYMGVDTLSRERATNITNHLLLSAHQGNTEAFQDWTRAATAYSANHPGQTPIMMDFGKMMVASMREQAIAKMYGSPLGTGPKNLVGMGMSRFGNLPSQ